ncbi:hypothetical protein HDA32_005759 [Spinactinospora alkalitolerans]|uniref:Uncharacterized protein n=1 Tax=Spinactinospora alkalitolerans TaxID=687207 RepID=A0A852U367_9ACTN|nr:hypothetical protein [Spinactinospora alkalitolerans]NYE50639.1 hypothetical protein [Spinactinospora alkalitolerans]
MARKVSEASLSTARPVSTRRRRRPSVARTRGTAPMGMTLPQPRETEETAAPARPLLRWVLTTDDNGRTRPEARWQ